MALLCTWARAGEEARAGADVQDVPTPDTARCRLLAVAAECGGSFVDITPPAWVQHRHACGSAALVIHVVGDLMYGILRNTTHPARENSR